MRLFLSFVFFIYSIPAFATVNVVKFPTATPVKVCTPSDSNSNCLTLASGPTILTSNVGIGSAVPGKELDVQGSIRAIQYFGDGSQLTGIVSGGNGNVGMGTAGWPAYYAANGTTVTATNALFIDSNKNIGIGTITPGSRLSSLGGASFGSFATTTAPIGGVIVSGNIGLGTITPITAIANTATQICDSSATCVNSSGMTYGSPANTGFSGYEVGITNPGGAAGNRNVLLLKSNSSTDNGSWIIRAENAAGPVFNVESSGNVGIGTTSSQGAFVVTNGNVGIGTWVPAQLLDVKGTAKMTGFTLSTSPTNGYVLTSDVNGNGTWSPASGGGSNFWVNSGSVGIGTYGNVGVGTISPTQALQVTSGNVNVTGTGNISFGSVGGGTYGSINTNSATNISLVASTCQVLGKNGGTSSSINTTGANLIVVTEAYIGSPVLSDNKSNSYTAVNTYSNVSNVKMVYSSSPTVGSGHTFTMTGTNIFASVCVQAWSSASTLVPIDQFNGATTGGATSLQTGSITPTQNNEIIIVGTSDEVQGTRSIDSGLTISDHVQGDLTNFFGAAIAYLVQPTGMAINPTWSWTGGTQDMATIIGSFTTASSPSGNLAFQTNGTERMRLTTGGNLGVGSTAPGQVLDVVGNIRTSTVSGQADGIMLCVKSGRVGYCSGSVTGVSCTCN